MFCLSAGQTGLAKVWHRAIDALSQSDGPGCRGGVREGWSSWSSSGLVCAGKCGTLKAIEAGGCPYRRRLLRMRRMALESEGLMPAAGLLCAIRTDTPSRRDAVAGRALPPAVAIIPVLGRILRRRQQPIVGTSVFGIDDRQRLAGNADRRE
jgi:hypothetical protein